MAGMLYDLQRPKRGRVSGLAGCAEAGARPPAPRALATRTACGCGGAGALCLRRRAPTHGRSVTRASWALRGRATGIVEAASTAARRTSRSRAPSRATPNWSASWERSCDVRGSRAPPCDIDILARCRARRARGPAFSDSSADRGAGRRRGRDWSLPRPVCFATRTAYGWRTRTSIRTTPAGNHPATRRPDNLSASDIAAAWRRPAPWAGGPPLPPRMPRNRPRQGRQRAMTARGLLHHPPA